MQLLVNMTQLTARETMVAPPGEQAVQAATQTAMAARY